MIGLVRLDHNGMGLAAKRIRPALYQAQEFNLLSWPV